MVVLLSIIIIISNLLSVFCQEQDQRAYRELITEPVLFVPETNRVINHAELPVVKDELSVTLKINIAIHGPDYYSVFYKGDISNRTPSLWIRPDDSSPTPHFTFTGDNIGFLRLDGYEFLLNRWYHIAYTLSDSEKRMNFYIDGKWVGSFSLTLIQNQSVVFNDRPLYIGGNTIWRGITGQISNFRYYNFRLSHKEVLMDYSGEDPTKSDEECLYPEISVGSFFLGIITFAAVAGGLFYLDILLINKDNIKQLPVK